MSRPNNRVARSEVRRALVTVLVIAGCAPAASSSPVAVVSPEPSPTHQPTAILHFTQPPQPPPTCEDLGFALTPDFDPPAAGSGFSTGRAPNIELRFDVIEVVDRADPTLTWTPDPDSLGRGDDVVGYIIGGRDAPLPIAIGTSWLGERLPIEITSAIAHLRVVGGSSHDVPLRIEEGPGGTTLPILRLPDIEATGFLDFVLAWQDQCLTYRASTTVRVRFVSRAAIDACPPGREDPSPYIEALEQPAPEAGGVPIRLMTSTVGWVWDNSALAVDGPIFGSFDPDATAATGAPGSSMRIAEANSDLAFSSVHVSFYRRAEIVGWDIHGDTPEPVVQRTANEQPDAAFRVRLPSDPGRYVAIAGFGWHSSCFTGQSRAIFAVDVE
jgi:hypothetical protein